MTTFDLKDRVAILTGTSSGIGLATAKFFLASGAKVLGVDVASSKDEELAKAGENFSFLQIDLAKTGSAEEVVKVCKEKFGERIDVLANIAGVLDNFGSVDTISAEQLDRVLNINLKAPISLMGAVVPSMRAQKSGAIINITSVAGRSGGTAGIAYTTSKHGLIGATKNVAWRFRDEGIRCNAVAPGGVVTNIFNAGADFDQAGMGSYLPFMNIQTSENQPKAIDPIEVARSIAFLAADVSIRINGVVLPVDQGTAALMP